MLTPRLAALLRAHTFSRSTPSPLVGKTLVEVVDVERLPGILHLIVAWAGAAAVLLLLRKLRPGWQECRGAA